jgi:hypothetical protein
MMINNVGVNRKAGGSLKIFIGRNRVGCVMQNSILTRKFCSGENTQVCKDKVTVLEIPVPDRNLLRCPVSVDGVIVNDNNAVRRNKGNWIANATLERFPSRKFVGLSKALKKVNEASNSSELEKALVDLYVAIQKVASYGGLYEEFINSLFSA